MTATLAAKIAEAEKALRDIREEINRQYWLFTRTARGKPVDPSVCRAEVDAENRLAALRYEAIL